MTPVPEKEAAAFLMLNRLGIAGRRKALAALREGKSAAEVLGLFPEDLEEIFKNFDAEKEMALCWQKGINLLTILDPCYPALLKEIPDPPLLLYIKGEIQENDANAVAIVGTRHPSFYGKTQAKRFAGELAAKGLTIVSGLARGIDQIAHEAALEIPFGRTIAVLGCGVDVIYPPENEKLYRRISERGAIVSEYSMGTPPLADNFPRRNRIISGLSLGVLVVEAHSRSGSLITAHQALDQGGEVFAIPGPVDQLTSRGTHQLLKEGAMLVENPDDIFDLISQRLRELTREDVRPTSALGVLFDMARAKSQTSRPTAIPVSETGPEVGAAGRERTSAESAKDEPHLSLNGLNASALAAPHDEDKAIEEVLKEEGPLTADEVLEFTGLDPAELPGFLLQLELAGKILKMMDGKYACKNP